MYVEDHNPLLLERLKYEQPQAKVNIYWLEMTLKL